MDKSEIKYLLANITQYPWKTVPDIGRLRISIFGNINDRFSVNRLARITGTNITANAEFIAKSPEIVASLLQEIEQLEAQLFSEVERVQSDSGNKVVRSTET
jgi:hypothetical protein